MQALPNILLPGSAHRGTIFLLLVALLSACGGGTTQNAGNNTNTFVTGVAATGLAINGSVTLKDATGATVNAIISQPSGTYSLDVAGLTPPFFLKATDSNGNSLYSVANSTGNFNINPLTNLAVVAAAMYIDPLTKTPDVVYNNPTSFASLTPAQIQAATASVMAKMSPEFIASLNANGANNFNPLTDTFQIGNGLDIVFDNFTITLDSSTGEVHETTVATSTIKVLGLVDQLGAFPAAGVYNGTVDTTQSGGSLHQVYDMLVTSAGEMRFVMDNGTQIIAHLTASGATVTGAGKAYVLTTLNGVPTNFKFADGSTAINLTINATLGSGTLSGTYSFGNYTDSFSFALNNTQTNASASLEKLAGTYASSTESSDIFIGHIEANGHIWGSSAGVAYSGLIQIIDPNINLYRVTLAYAQSGTYGYVSGLATFYDVSPAADALPKPTALVADGYTGEISSLSYGQTAPVPHGKLLLQLTSPLQQIFVSAVRLSPQIQTIAIKPTADSLMIQSVGNPSFSITTAGDIQYSGSATATMFAGIINSSAGNINLISNPGNIILKGDGSITIQVASLSSGSLTPICDVPPIVATPPVGTLFITANPACKTYDAQAYSGGNGVTYTGFLNGDTPSVLGGTLIYSGTSQGAKNVGTYTIIPGGLTSDSYNIIYVDSTFTVNQLSLGPISGNTVKIYDGSIVTGGLVGFVSGESPTLSGSLSGEGGLVISGSGGLQNN